jgi:hypothetical protein
MSTMVPLVRKNERREMRRALRFGCKVVDQRKFTLVADRAVDLSPEGMLVPSESGLEVGEELIVSFRATELGLWFDTEARVTRVVHGRRPGDIGRCFGLRFLTLPAVSRLILRGHLRKVPPPLPKRAQRIDYAATIRRIQAERIDYAAAIRQIAGLAPLLAQ